MEAITPSTDTGNALLNLVPKFLREIFSAAFLSCQCHEFHILLLLYYKIHEDDWHCKYDSQIMITFQAVYNSSNRPLYLSVTIPINILTHASFITASMAYRLLIYFFLLLY